MNRKLTCVLAGALILCFGHRLKAEDADRFSLDSAGARFGFAAKHSDRGFRAGEAFLDCNLPVSWQLGDSFSLKVRLDFTAGWLGREGLDAVTSSAGPTFVLKYKDVPLALEAGSSSGLISRHEFGDANLGGPIQFTTCIGLSWDIAPHWRAGYLFEHTSNAGIYKSNPGLNLHTFAFSYVF